MRDNSTKNDFVRSLIIDRARTDRVPSFCFNRINSGRAHHDVTDLGSVFRQIMENDKSFRLDPIENFSDATFPAFAQTNIPELRIQTKSSNTAVTRHEER